MADTPTAPTVTLPVRLTIGDHTSEIGELTIAPGKPFTPALADLFRAAADALDRTAQEVTPDAAP
ncbi:MULTISPECIES: hypothetical protein [Streptomyces]|uniref:hypothetical protein n=1 Tax=Streptomyces TaxID=1883 RepID=UPI0004CD5217|nr:MULTISPECIES: hypothetical protein [Streptomyces]